jgi:multiple sugar transport system ATP-binding protein
MARIVLDHVDKRYAGDVKAVNNLSLEVHDGEFIVLVGPSGCGKSTALRIIAGLEDITRGTVQIGDKIVTDLPPGDRDIAMVFQNYALYPQLNVAQNMAFGLRMHKTPKREIARRVQDAAKILGLEPYLTRKPGALSGGQRQRVAMGRAIVREPQAFLMDEPLSNLDAKLRVGMRASLKQLHERLKVTTVYVTHDQVEAMTLGDRVCVIRDGILQQVDTPKQLFDHPVNLFVGGFIGSPSMNLVTARVISGDDGEAVTFAGHQLPIPERVAHATPEIKAYSGRDVILGIRPSDFEDASLADESWTRMAVVARLTEALGSETHVIFAIDAPPVEHQDIVDLAPREEKDESAIPLDEGKTLWTARVSARSGVRAGDQIELGVDTSKMHFFDPESGLAIGAGPGRRRPTVLSSVDGHGWSAVYVVGLY